jgi:mRNA interferase YafQ
MYKIVTIPEFDKLFVKITKNNSLLKTKIIACIEKLAQDPFYPSLRSHKVDTKKYNEVWSSSITGDWRIVWAFDKDEELIIVCLQLGTHSGSNQIYNNKS